MNYGDDVFSLGDSCFLFLSLDIDRELIEKLPIEIYPGIHLAPVPRRALRQGARQGSSEKEHIGLAAWVYPGYGVIAGMCPACIKVDVAVPYELRNRYFWIMAGALFLAKPLHMHIAGSFEYGDAEDGLLGRKPGRIDHRSNICLNTFVSHEQGKFSLHYDMEDLNRAGMYFPLLWKIFESRRTEPRPYFNVKAFFEAVLWERLHYASSSFSKLFPLIDSFTGNPIHDHCKKASKRLGSFLSQTPSVMLDTPLTAKEIELRLQCIWESHRPPGIHGYLKELDLPETAGVAQAPVDSAELKDLFDLMEFSRMAVVKMLLLDEASYQDYCQIPIPGKYSSKNSKKSAEAEREFFSNRFFGKTYPNPDCMKASMDFVGDKNSSPHEELAAPADSSV